MDLGAQGLGVSGAPSPSPLPSCPSGEGGGSCKGQEHEVMETQAVRGGPHVPWERDELWAPFISTRSPWRWRRGARREMGLSLSRAWPGTGIPCERCLRPGHQGPKNPGPGPAPPHPGDQVPAPRSDHRTLAPRPSNPSRALARDSQGDFGEESVYQAESRELLGTRAGQGRGRLPERPRGRIHNRIRSPGLPSQGCSRPRLPGTGGFRGPGTFSGTTSTTWSPQTRPDAHPALGGRDL